jgi:hypothetical protein
MNWSIIRLGWSVQKPQILAQWGDEAAIGQFRQDCTGAKKGRKLSSEKVSS